VSDITFLWFVYKLCDNCDNIPRGCSRWGAPAMGPSLQLSTCMLFWGFLGLFVPAVEGTKPRSLRSVNQRWSYGDFLQTAQLAAVTLAFDPLTLKLVHGMLVSQRPFLPSLVFVGLSIFPLGGGTEQTDRRTGSTHDGASFYEGWPHNNLTCTLIASGTLINTQRDHVDRSSQWHIAAEPSTGWRRTVFTGELSTGCWWIVRVIHCAGTVKVVRIHVPGNNQSLSTDCINANQLSSAYSACRLNKKKKISRRH